VDTHAKLVAYVQKNAGPCDVLLVGDSITQQWGSPLDKGVLNTAWLKAFPNTKTINIGIGGDKAQNVLWRLDHGGVDGLKPKAIVLMIGNNNMFFTPETGVTPVAQGVKACLANLREKFPEADVVVAKILPCHAPKVRFYEDILLTNAEIDKLNLGADPKVRVLDLTKDFLNADGTIKQALFTADKIHLSLSGYEVYAQKLAPLLKPALGR
jgi:lysophospholipase L1-like esterase